MIRNWSDAVAFALSLPGTQRGTHYGKPSVELSANGRSFVFPSHEAETSFGIALDLDTVEMLKEIEPATFWQTPHYVGWEAVLVRYGDHDSDRVEAMIERSRDWAATKKPVKPRARK